LDRTHPGNVSSKRHALPLDGDTAIDDLRIGKLPRRKWSDAVGISLRGTIPDPHRAPRNNGRFRDAGDGGVIVGDFPSGRSQPHRLPHQAGRYQAISGAVERVTTRALPTAIIDDLRRIASDRRKKAAWPFGCGARQRQISRVCQSHLTMRFTNQLANSKIQFDNTV